MSREAGAGPITAIPGGIRLQIQVQPRASRSEVSGLHGEAIRIRLAAPPVDGAANEELVRFLASRLGVTRSAVTLERGQTGRRKTVSVTGVTGEEARSRLFPGS